MNITVWKYKGKNEQQYESDHLFNLKFHAAKKLKNYNFFFFFFPQKN